MTLSSNKQGAIESHLGRNLTDDEFNSISAYLDNDPASTDIQYLIEVCLVPDRLKTTAYRVTWAIDVEADSALDAARQARSMQSDGTSANVFNVVSPDGESEQIDLSELGESEPVKRYAVGSNMPGYMPDDEAHVVDTLLEAKGCLRESIQQHIDADGDAIFDDLEAAEQTTKDIETLDEFCRAVPQECNVNINGRIYWITEADQSNPG